VAGTTGTAGTAGINLPNVWIAFDSDRDFNRDIYMIRPDGTDLTRLTSEPSIDKEPAFSPGGDRLAFTSDRGDDGFQIYLLDVASRQVTRVTQRAEGADQSRFSPDGQLITFHSGASVYVIRPGGTEETLVATGADSFNAYFWPAFSADGQQLVFDRNNEINAVRLDGSGLRKVVQNWTTTIKSPTVSPGGSEIAYHVYCDDGGASIWTTPFSTVTDPCGGRRLTPLGQPPSQRPAWGPDNWFAYERVDKASNVATIALISRTEGVPRILTIEAPGSVAVDSRNPSWSR
jgi:Tol biopolymer transport system component